MYENIDLDAVESNEDEAPDYRPMLKKSGSLGAPAEIRYRMNYLSTLETEEKSRYEEFARVAQGEGMSQIARVFREIMREEERHSDSLAGHNATLSNLRIAIDRELSKLETIKSVIGMADEKKDRGLLKKLQTMLEEETGHVKRLRGALEGLEKDMRAAEKKREGGKKAERVCSMGVCTEQHDHGDHDAWIHSDD
jgi:rubrerythrin